MGQALYRDYRPKSFDEVVGQDHITTTLSRAIKNGRISHAYLFTGPRGVGKTSIARILAHAVNDLPYTDESMHLDIIEIDAASNRRIDEIRELRDKVHVSPAAAKYKVYIIDEVHMLTREAFNALLKTLEEPPAHVIFILATTEAHKLPETIVSRTQRFEFKPIAENYAVEHLAAIAKKEKIKIDKQALTLLAEHGEGSFRDSIGLLDQLATTGDQITEQDVRQFLGLPPEGLIAELIESIGRGSPAGTVQKLDELRESGSNAATLAKLLAKAIRQEVVAGNSEGWMNELLRDLIEVPGSFSPIDNLEIALLKATAANIGQTGLAKATLAPTAPTVEPAPAKKEEPAKAKAEPKPVTKEVVFKEFSEEAWDQIVGKVKDQAASLYTALRLADPSAADGKLTLTFQFPLHQKKVNQAEHRDLIGKIVAEVTGQDMVVEPVVGEKAAVVVKKPAPKKDDDKLKTISNIFGSTEVLES